MKKLITLLCLSALMANAQPYGEKIYPNPGAVCSSGNLTSNHSNGFVFSSYVPTATPGTPNFYVNKTGPTGVFSPTASAFSQTYQVYGTSACNGSSLQAMTLAGVDVIESGAGMSWWYAVAGAYEQAVFFCTLSQAGAEISERMYYPSGTFLNPTKPIIVQGLIPDHYYIAGSYNNGTANVAYILHVNNTGILVSSQIYTYPNLSKSLTVSDFLLSPFSPSGSPELVMVGTTNDITGSTGARGFAMRVNAAALTGVLSFNEFGHVASATGGADSFGCITVDNSAGGTGAFAIGGSSNLSSGNGAIWVTNVDASCSTVNWSNILKPALDPSAQGMVDIIQRFSPSYGYTYYGAVLSQAGSMVLKLNSTGGMFTALAPIDNFNEFLYKGTAALPGKITALTAINNGAPSDVGIQAYCTRTSNTQIHFVEAAFNGDSDMGVCTQSKKVTGALTTAVTANVTSGSVSQPGVMSWCLGIAIVFGATPTTVSNMCLSAGLPAGGSNHRLAMGIEEQHGNSGLKVSPNPVSDHLNLSFDAAENDAVDIRLFDYLGRLVSATPVISYNNGTATASLEMSKFTVESGMYVIRATINGVTSTQKIIYTKGQ